MGGGSCYFQPLPGGGSADFIPMNGVGHEFLDLHFSSCSESESESFKETNSPRVRKNRRKRR